MLIDRSFAASRCPRRLAVRSTLPAFRASSQYTPVKRAGLLLKAGESHSDHD
jgi:hypothetical protein